MIDFADYGYPGYLPISQHEMTLLLAGAERLLQAYAPDAVDEMITQQHTQLFLAAFDSHAVTPQWVSNVTLLIALQGLRGKTLPDIRWDD